MLKLKNRPLQRVLAAIVAFCYFWLSTVVACQHNHHAILDAAAQVEGLQFAANGRPEQSLLAVQWKAGSRVQGAAHCAACEWQAASVSPALPAFTLVLTAPCAPRAVATPPLYFSLIAPTASSRAPPLA